MMKTILGSNLLFNLASAPVPHHEPVNRTLVSFAPLQTTVVMEGLQGDTINLMSLRDNPLKLGPLYGDKTLIGILPDN